VSLDGFYQGLAALAADPELARGSRAGDREWLRAFDLSPEESGRLVTMAADNGMEVLCSLYRSNRLTALVGTVPGVVYGLGERLDGALSVFWKQVPRSDMQFRTESLAFCDFVRDRYPDDGALQEALAAAGASVIDHYGRR